MILPKAMVQKIFLEKFIMAYTFNVSPVIKKGSVVKITESILLWVNCEINGCKNVAIHIYMYM